MRFQFLKDHQEQYNVKRACKTLHISRSGFYEYLKRKESDRAIENKILSQEIKHVFEEHKGRYGCLRISKALENEGLKINHKRVQKLMRSMGLYAKGTRYRYKHYHSSMQNEERPNLLNQVFQPTGRNKIWLGDITCVPTKKGVLYLAVFLDIFSRKITGWSMGRNMKDTLVTEAFMQGYGRELPEDGLIVHTDQGSQYTSGNFRRLLKQHKAIHSNSRKGNPYDNAMMESFYRTLKRELILDARFETPEQAQMEIFKYIELYYNTKRMHSALGYISPVQFEQENS